MRPSTSLAPHQGISQNHAQEFPTSLSVLKVAEQTGLHPLWKVLLGFQSRHPLAAALLFLTLALTPNHVASPYTPDLMVDQGPFSTSFQTV